jgi:ABC-type uncharacterized transport system substrate-binding protein
MLAALKKMALGLGLIAGSAAILLYSDLGSRHVQARGARHTMRVAIVQQISIPALDDGISGALAALKDRGFIDGGRMAVTRYNAQGDISTGNAIAKEVTSSDYDLILSFSTVSLQTIANANRFATPPRKHVFALVSDPYAVGVGISRENHMLHPPYMTGVGSLAPVEDAFKLARRMRPSLKRVGLVWDPSEANSVVTTELARQVCASMGITLLEADAENSTSISDATASLLARGVDAIWISPDLIASHGMPLIIAKARLARIPVFTSIPSNADSGALFELGADYFSIGRVAGNLAADVLEGRDPATVPVENVVPITLQLDTRATSGLRDKWQIPGDVLASANVVVDGAGRHVRNSPAQLSASAAAPAGAGAK